MRLFTQIQPSILRQVSFARCLAKRRNDHYPAGMHDSQFVTIEMGSRNKSAPASLAEFPPEVLARFSDLLQRDVECDSSLDWYLRTIAWSYQAQKNNTNKTARAAKRSRQRKAAQAAQKALDAINQLQTGDVVPFVIEGGVDAYHRLLALTRLLEHWSPIMHHVAQRKLPPAREANDLVSNICGWLKSVYDENSGRNATHNTMLEAIDVGEPASAFGLFVVAFFRHVDPSISPGELREPLKRAVWPSYQ